MDMKNSPPQKVCTHQCQSILALPDNSISRLISGCKKNIDGDLEVLVACVAGAVKAAPLECIIKLLNFRQAE